MAFWKMKNYEDGCQELGWKEEQVEFIEFWGSEHIL